MEIIRFARNNIYRIGTNSTACAVSVPVGNTEMLELCRAIVKFEREGHTITSVMKLCSNGFDDSVNFRNLKEYALALKEKVQVIVEGEFKRYCASGACLKSPCKVNKTTYRVFDIVPIGEIGDDDEIMECYVNFEDSDCRKEIRLINLDEEDMDAACLDSTILDTFQHILNGGKVSNYGYWFCTDKSVVSLEDAIHFIKQRVFENHLKYAPEKIVSDFLQMELPKNVLQSKIEELIADKMNAMSREEFDILYSKYEKCSDCFGSYHYDVNSNLV